MSEEYKQTPGQSGPLRDRRAQMISRIEGLDFDAAASEALKGKGLLRTPFPAVPEELYGVLHVIIPAETDREGWGDETASVLWTRAVQEQYGSNISPVLADVNLSALEADTLIAMFSFCNSYQAYLSDLLAKLRSDLNTLETRFDLFNAEALLLYTTEGSTPTIARAQIKSDPYYRELIEKIGRLRAMTEYVATWCDTANKTQSLCSRLMTHTHNQLEAFRNLQGAGKPGGKRTRGW